MRVDTDKIRLHKIRLQRTNAGKARLALVKEIIAADFHLMFPDILVVDHAVLHAALKVLEEWETKSSDKREDLS